MSLNEKNIQACFQYNASTGNWIFEKVEGNLLTNLESPRVRGQVGSDKIAIDLGYSVDGKVNDWKFTIDGIGMLAIKTVAMRNDLIRLPIEKNECAIVTNDPNFRTILWLNYENYGKKLNYSFTTLNSSISCWVGDEIAKKLNAYDPTALDNRIKDTENRVTIAKERLNTAETNITALQTGLSEEITARETADTEETNSREDADKALNTRLITLEEKTAKLSRNAEYFNTIFDDNLVVSNDHNLTVTGDSIISGSSTVEGESILQNTSVKDFTVRGVVNGELKDSQGYSYIKIKKGTAINSNRFTNMAIEYDGITAIVKGNYSVVNIQKVPSFENHSLLALPLSFITKLKRVFFYSTKKENLFSISTTINDDTSFFINFGNITKIEQDIQLTTFDFTIETEINPNDASIIWS